MTVGVSHTFGGTVVVVDMDSGTRWDMTPAQAVAGAEKLESTFTDGVTVYAGIEVIECDDGRSFRFSGHKEDFAVMAADLRKHAAAAKEMGRLTR